MEGNLHEGHRQRLKDKFLNNGLESLSEHEVVELLLFYAIPQKDTNKLAHSMLNEYKKINSLFEADPLDIMNKCGVSKNTATLVSLIPSLARLYLKGERVPVVELNNPQKVGEYAIPSFVGKLNECFVIFCINSQNKLNHEELIQEGTLAEVAVYPRKIIEIALRYKAHSVIIAHNHPGGSLVPSQDDINITNTVKAALETVDIKFNDHIIVAGNKYISLKQHNYF